jgi:hypothetical protein
MLWPFDPVVVPDPIDLVDADHGDVIGHFALAIMRDARIESEIHQESRKL